MRKHPCSIFIFDNADGNVDGIINISDITSVVNIMLKR